MATSTVASAKRDGTPVNSRPLTRLLRYVLPYWWQFLASVLLMALVGLLDAFRVLLIGPIFDRVLNPGSQEQGHAAVQAAGQRAQSLICNSWFPPTFTIPGRWWRLRWWRRRC